MQNPNDEHKPNVQGISYIQGRREQWIADNFPEIQVLDKGFVRLVDYMGTDNSIVQAARVSYASGSKGREQDKKLLKYLLTNRHTSPFEQVSFKFHCKMPIFVARQWVRHRTAKLNEVSGRYTQLKDEFYIPELSRIQGQDEKNKQGSSGEIPQQDLIRDSIIEQCNTAYNLYKRLLDRGLSKELARMILPLNIYTEWYWKIDLHNLLHFLGLRLDSHAQGEIQEYAKAMYSIIKNIVPDTCEIFEEQCKSDPVRQYSFE